MLGLEISRKRQSVHAGYRQGPQLDVTERFFKSAVVFLFIAARTAGNVLSAMLRGLANALRQCTDIIANDVFPSERVFRKCALVRTALKAHPLQYEVSPEK